MLSGRFGEPDGSGSAEVDLVVEVVGEGGIGRELACRPLNARPRGRGPWHPRGKGSELAGAAGDHAEEGIDVGVGALVAVAVEVDAAAGGGDGDEEPGVADGDFGAGAVGRGGAEGDGGVDATVVGEEAAAGAEGGDVGVVVEEAVGLEVDGVPLADVRRGQRVVPSKARPSGTNGVPNWVSMVPRRDGRISNPMFA